MASIAPRQGLQALVTRPREEAETLAAALAARGVGAMIEPLIEVRFRAERLPDLAGVQAVLCTSANGARALARASSERSLPLLAVGEATAARARAAGFVSVASAGGSSADLVRLAAERLRPQDGRLLHISGDTVAGDLAGGLRAHGFRVGRKVLYEARPVAALSPAARHALGSGAIDFALFFSPRTAALFVDLATGASLGQSCAAITALSISAAADAALAELPWRQRRMAQRPTQPALLDALDRLLVEAPRA
ncbi:MAG TPA: uroporphyrinogen-III synthase [Stellaceae bacterium]|jgi:uroporphyrinogen-III synthase